MHYACYLAFKQLFPSGRRISLFALASIIGVSLGVMTLVVVQAVMSGFSGAIEERLNQASGDIRIESDTVIYDADALLSQLRDMPAVALAEPYAKGFVMMQHQQRPAFPEVIGIDMRMDSHVMPIEDYLIAGSLEALDDDRILIGSGLARSVRAGIGSRLEVYTPLMIERLKADEVLLPREFEVAGIFETQQFAVDNSTMIVTLRTMQDLYGLDETVHGVAVNVTESADVETVALSLNRTLPESLHAFTWMDAHSGQLSVLAFEKTTMFLINLIIVLVAAFSISVALYTAVLRKTREIGLLGAMGAQPGGIAAMYCLQGLLVGVIGSVFGVAGALLLLAFRKEILSTVLRWFESEATYLRFYNFLNPPVRYEADTLATILIFTIVMTTLAGLLPAIVAARKNPAEALRFD